MESEGWRSRCTGSGERVYCFAYCGLRENDVDGFSCAFTGGSGNAERWALDSRGDPSSSNRVAPVGSGGSTSRRRCGDIRFSGGTRLDRFCCPCGGKYSTIDSRMGGSGGSAIDVCLGGGRGGAYELDGFSGNSCESVLVLSGLLPKMLSGLTDLACPFLCPRLPEWSVSPTPCLRSDTLPMSHTDRFFSSPPISALRFSKPPRGPLGSAYAACPYVNGDTRGGASSMKS